MSNPYKFKRFEIKFENLLWTYAKQYAFYLCLFSVLADRMVQKSPYLKYTSYRFGLVLLGFKITWWFRVKNNQPEVTE